MSLVKAMLNRSNGIKDLKRMVEDKKNEEKLQEMLKAQEALLENYSADDKKPKKHFDASTLELGGMTYFKMDKKWVRISVLTRDNEADITKFKFHFRNSYGNKVFISAKTYIEAQAVADAIYSQGMYKVSGSVV